MHGPLTLTMKELDRLDVMTRIAERRLTRRMAAALLRIGERQVRRLYRAFVQAGAAGLVSRRRGRPSARRLPAAASQVRARVTGAGAGATTTGSRHPSNDSADEHASRPRSPAQCFWRLFNTNPTHCTQNRAPNRPLPLASVARPIGRGTSW